MSYFNNTIEFDLDTVIEIEGLETFEKNIDNNDFVEVVAVEKEWSTTDILQEFNSFIGSLQYEVVSISEYKISNDDDFRKYQYMFLMQDYCCIDISDNILRLVTRNKDAFEIDLENIGPQCVLMLLNSTYAPGLVCTNIRSILSLNEFHKSKIYNLETIIKIFFNKSIHDLKELIEFFMTNSDNNYNCLLYNLFKIRDITSELLQKYKLMPLINKEFKVAQIATFIENVGIPISEEKLTSFTNILNTNLDEAIKNFEDKFFLLKDKLNNNTQGLIKTLKDNKLPPSLNEEFLNSVGDAHILPIILANRICHAHSKDINIENNRMFIKYDTYDEFGNISRNFTIDKYYISNNKPVLEGIYENLYLRIFTDLSNIDYLIEDMNNNTLIESLSERIFKSKEPIALFKAKYLLHGFIEGYTTAEKLNYYCFNNLSTYVSLKNITNHIQLFESNCPEVIDFINGFNRRDISKDKRISLADVSLLHKIIKLIEADIYKDLIINVYQNIVSYNLSNKEKINIVALQENGILLESDSGALNISVDILNRCLSSSYSKYISKVRIVGKVTKASP